MPSVRTLPGVRTLTLPDGTRVVADRMKEVTLRLATLDRAPEVARSMKPTSEPSKRLTSRVI